MMNTMNQLYLNYTIEIDHLKNLPIFHMIFSVKDDYEKNDVLFSEESFEIIRHIFLS